MLKETGERTLYAKQDRRTLQLKDHWAHQAIFYHIYPLGFCGAPYQNNFSSAPSPRLEKIYSWLDHIQSLGANALYLGPLFESSTHGYDTRDYFQVDRRLGTNETLARLSQELHDRGIRLVLDGVFNHVGRHFWAFQDVLTHGEHSAYRDWFSNLRFGQRSPFNDPFSYEGWNNHYELVKLNLHNPAVRDHLFQAIKTWIDRFDIDGLRLDTADSLELSFLDELSAFTRGLRPDFWLMGEVIHGDYNHWVNSTRLDSVTNYECYKGLYSSHVDHNYFEIAYAFNRQFGPDGIYKDLLLYNFADNHDVDRVASNLSNPAHLYTLYCLLFTMPGIPSIYYGSEWGLDGKRSRYSDRSLRPALELAGLQKENRYSDLPNFISTLSRIRKVSPALQYGNYQQLYLDHEQFAYLRQAETDQVIVAVNAAEEPAKIHLKLPPNSNGQRFIDLLNPGTGFVAQGEEILLDLYPCWARLLRSV